ncbi:hypothetical protein N784_05665 [Pontibacillus litoralis JSM 072002]|uniref:YdbS-like PH domain-containing protein n=1 Tax=Pontibacillus litoralis JSM 072002 TaxID=1385512 RepID=A0A0A5G4Z9_9BACI|nr:hypothetical protein N784_05665 [Pontibacillus litoralis JSM 072002]
MTFVSSICVAVILLVVNHFLQLHKFIDYALYGFLVLDVLYVVYAYGMKPVYLLKSWRYEVDEDFVRLKYGLWIQNSVIIPMTKVQSVQKTQGVLMRKYGLAEVSVVTTASSHEIPCLEEEVATVLRDQIAILAKVEDVEEIKEVKEELDGHAIDS